MKADMDKARRAGSLPSEMQNERENVKQSMSYAVHFHEGGGGLNDMQKLGDRKKKETISKEENTARWEPVATKTHKWTAYVCKKNRN